MTQVRSLVFANSLTSYLRVVVSLVVSFLLVPFILRHVGGATFGLWSLLFSVLGMVALLDFGLGSSAVKFLSHYSETGDKEARNRVFSVILLAYAVLTVVAFFAIAAVSLYFNELFSIPKDQRSVALVLLWILGLRVVLGQLPLNLFRNVLFGEQRIVVINVITMAGQVLYGLLCWWTLSTGGSIYSLAMVNLFTMLLEHLAYLVLAYQRVDGLRFTLKGMTWDQCGELFQFSGYQGILNVAALVLLQMDLMIVKAYMTLEAVAIYAIALRLTSQLRLLVKHLMSTISPYLIDPGNHGSSDQARHVLLQGTQLVLVPGLSLAVALYFLGFDFIRFWVGSDYQQAYSLLVLLMAALVVGLPSKMASQVLGMTGSHRFVAQAAFATVAVNFVLSVFFVQWWGLWGVAFATLVAVMSVDFTLVVGQARQRCSLTWSDYLRDGCVPALVPAGVQGAFLAMVLHGTTITGIWGIFLLGSLSLAVYLAVYWALYLDGHIKTLILGQVLRRAEG